MRSEEYIEEDIHPDIELPPLPPRSPPALEVGPAEHKPVKRVRISKYIKPSYLLCFLTLKVHIQNHPSVLIQSTIHHEVFTAGALEKRVRRTRTLAGSDDNRLYQHTRVFAFIVPLTQNKL